MEIAVAIIGLVITAITGIGGALWGARVGAKMSADYAKKLADDAELDRNRAAAFAVHHKVSRIYGQTTALHAIMATALAKARAEKVVWSLQIDEPANPLPLFHFTVEEHFRAFRYGGSPLANAIMILDEEHNALVATFAEFFRRRTVLNDRIVNRENGLLAGEITVDAFRSYQDDFEKLDEFLEYIQRIADRLRREAFAAILVSMQARIVKLGEDFAYSIESPDGKFTYIGKPPTDGSENFVPRTPEDRAAAHAKGEP